MPCSASRARNRLSTLASNPVSVSSTPSAYFQSMARTAIAAACRSVRSSANCNTVTRPNTPGDSPGAPRTPNAPANGSSTKTSVRRSRTRIARLPCGNADRATSTVCSGISGSPFGRIDIHTTPTAARQDNDRTNDHPAPATTPAGNCAAESGRRTRTPTRGSYDHRSNTTSAVTANAPPGIPGGASASWKEQFAPDEVGIPDHSAALEHRLAEGDRAAAEHRAVEGDRAPESGFPIGLRHRKWRGRSRIRMPTRRSALGVGGRVDAFSGFKIE